MSALLPPSTNASYRGATISSWYLALVGLLTILPGCIHYFLPDGGAHSIASIDLSTRRNLVLAMFAWIGSMQIPHGIGELVVAIRYRSLTPLFLLLAILERGLMAYDGWLGKAAVDGHHPPEHYASVVAVVLGGLFFALSLRDSQKGSNP